MEARRRSNLRENQKLRDTSARRHTAKVNKCEDQTVITSGETRFPLYFICRELLLELRRELLRDRIPGTSIDFFFFLPRPFLLTTSMSELSFSDVDNGPRFKLFSSWPEHDTPLVFDGSFALLLSGVSPFVSPTLIDAACSFVAVSASADGASRALGCCGTLSTVIEVGAVFTLPLSPLAILKLAVT